MRSLYRTLEKFDRISVVGKEWGYEVWHFNTPVLCQKTLVVYPNFACSYHGHSIKYEVFTCLDSGPSNQLYITVGIEPERLMKPGNYVIIQPGVKHTFRCAGTEPAALLEFSTHHREDDSYRAWPSHQYIGGNIMGSMSNVEAMKGMPVLIIGDVSLDRYHVGSAHRLSPEAPCPIVNLNPYSPDMREAPGCAGNVAMNVSALGGRAMIISCVGEDPDGEMIVDRLSEMSIDTGYIMTSEQRPTSSKTRIMSGHYHICRVDYEVTEDMPDDLQNIACVRIHNAIMDFNPLVIYLADYDKGFLTDRIIQHVITEGRKKGTPVVADPKHRNFFSYNGVDVLKPNEVRAAEVMALPYMTHTDIENLGAAIHEEMSAIDWVLLTRGEKGMYLASSGPGEKMDEVVQTRQHIPARYVEVSELSGAGDTCGAALALAMAGGMCVPDAAHVANVAASIVVQKAGTALCTPSELSEALTED
jgi:rfaE bifunctional protein kinase chain/domain